MDAIIQVIEDWSSGKDRNYSTFSIFFDFAKAFDTVDHEQLLTKLRDKIKLEPWLISWIASYLTGRQQRVKSGKLVSEWADVEEGVIQGSVLGPILFILFISDINDAVPPGVEIAKYADDIIAYVTYNEKSNVDHLPQEIVDGIHAWCQTNKMKLNIGKCKCLTVHHQKNQILPLPNIGGTELELVPSYKYLGVNLCDSFVWDDQWARVQKIVSRVPYVLKSLKQSGFTTSILIAVYRCYALSHFAYSAPVLTSTSAAIMGEMSSFHRRCLRIIGITQEDAIVDHRIPAVEAFIDQQCINIAQKIYHDPLHPATAHLARNTREGAAFKFKLPIARRKPYEKSFIQKFFRALRDRGMMDRYKNRDWGLRGSKYNGTTLKPKAIKHVKVAEPPPPPPSPQPAARPFRSTCPTCHKGFMSLNAGGARHTPEACANYLAAYNAQQPPLPQ